MARTLINGTQISGTAGQPEASEVVKLDSSSNITSGIANLTASTGISASYFMGEGSGLTGISSDSVDVTDSSANTEFRVVAVAASGLNNTLVTQDTEGLRLRYNPSTGRVSGSSFASAGAISAGGRMVSEDTTEATSTTDGSLQTDGGLSVAKDCIFGNDVKLLTDSSVFNMGVSSDFTITHDGATGATLAGNPITITSAGAATWSTSAGALVIDGAAGLTLDSDGTDAVNLGTEAVAKTITIGNAASTKVDVNALALDFDSAAATDILAASTLSAKGATGASFGDDTGTWEFDGSGNLTQTGMVAVTVTPSAALTLTAGAASTWSTSAGALTLDAAAAGLVLDGHTGVDIDASNSGKVSIDGAGGIDIGVAADVAIDVDSAAFDLDASGAITIDGTSTIGIGANAAAGAINIGTNATAREVTIGNSTGASGVTIACGTGDVDIASSGNVTTIKGTFNVDEAATFDTTVGVTGATTLAGDITPSGATEVTVDIAADSFYLHDSDDTMKRDSIANVIQASARTSGRGVQADNDVGQLYLSWQRETFTSSSMSFQFNNGVGSASLPTSPLSGAMSPVGGGAMVFLNGQLQRSGSGVYGDAAAVDLHWKTNTVVCFNNVIDENDVVEVLYFKA